MNTKVHFSSASDNWATPQWLFDELSKEFSFQLDACASEANAKCVSYISSEQDGLKQSWEVLPTKAVWMNPPYGRTIGLWVKKASEEAALGSLVVALLPARPDTRWFHDYIYNIPGVELRLLKGRLKFGDAKNSAPFPSMVVIFRPVVK